MAQASSALGTMIPLLRYENPPVAVDWLVEAFGFEKRVMYPDQTGAIVHWELGLGSGMVMIGLGAGDEQLTVPHGAKGSIGIYVYIEDVDAHYARAKETGAVIEMEPWDTAHGSREYACRDFEGNLWCFGNYAPGSYE